MKCRLHQGKTLLLQCTFNKAFFFYTFESTNQSIALKLWEICFFHRCPLFLNIPSYCRMVIDPNDSCCKIPVCQTEAPPTPAPTVTLNPPFTPSPTGTGPTPAPNPNPQPSPTPMPKGTCLMLSCFNCFSKYFALVLIYPFIFPNC